MEEQPPTPSPIANTNPASTSFMRAAYHPPPAGKPKTIHTVGDING